MRKERKHYTAEEKVTILRRHLLDHVPVSDLCEENGLQPTVFYRWQKEFFENGASAFQAKERPARQVQEKQKRVKFGSSSWRRKSRPRTKHIGGLYSLTCGHFYMNFFILSSAVHPQDLRFPGSFRFVDYT